MSRQTWKMSVGFIAVVALVLGAALPASAVVLTSTNNVLNAGYTVSSTDRLGGLTPTSVHNDGAGWLGSGTSAVLTDGAFGAVGADVTGGYYFMCNNDHNPCYVEYTLDTSVNTLGYNITEIATYTSDTSGGRNNQDYTVSYATVGAPGVFHAIATVAYDPPDGGNPWPPQSIRVVLTDSSGVLASGVGQLHFEMTNPQENGAVLYRELDVLGSPIPVPEPATIALLAIGGLGMLIRRRHG